MCDHIEWTQAARAGGQNLDHSRLQSKTHQYLCERRVSMPGRKTFHGDICTIWRLTLLGGPEQ
jgi:hypothetical protein